MIVVNKRFTYMCEMHINHLNESLFMNTRKAVVPPQS